MRFSLLTTLLLLQMWIQIKSPIIITTLCRDIWCLCFLPDSRRRQHVVSHADGPFVWPPWTLWRLLPTDDFLATKQPSDGQVCHWRKRHCPGLQHDLDFRSVDESCTPACWVWFLGQGNNSVTYLFDLHDLCDSLTCRGSHCDSRSFALSCKMKRKWTDWEVVL